MATKTQTVTDYDRIKQLQDEQRRVTAELKAAEAAISPLDRVILHQETTPANLILLARAKGRVSAGQTTEEAIEAVLESAREWLTEALAEETSEDETTN